MSSWASLLRASAPSAAAAAADSSSACHFPVILDANALIRGDLNYIRSLGADDVVTLPAVLAEVRDKVSREMLASWPVKPSEMSPDAASVAFVEAFAKATGDINTLSRQDIKVLALAVMLERRVNGGVNLRDKPQINVLRRVPASAAEAGAAAALKADEDWGEEGKDEDGGQDDEGEEAADAGSSGSSLSGEVADDGDKELALLNAELAALDANISDNASSFPAEVDDNDDGDWQVVSRKRDQTTAHRDSSSKATVLPGWYNGDDDEAGWIGPTSTHASSLAASRSTFADQSQHVVSVPHIAVDDSQASLASDSVLELPSSPCVRVVTADFAMQNVLLQMGIQVIGTGGKMVKAVKTFVLKCHSCFKICMDASREFCPHCGNHTMMKVSMAVDENGVVHYSRGIKRFNLRGTQYSIPLPKGGRRNTDIILCEDQLLRNRKPKAKADDAFDSAAAGFGAVGVSHSENARYGHRRRNPNERRTKLR